jgi:hypothetical protein
MRDRARPRLRPKYLASAAAVVIVLTAANGLSARTQGSEAEHAFAPVPNEKSQKAIMTAFKANFGILTAELQTAQAAGAEHGQSGKPNKLRFNRMPGYPDRVGATPRTTRRSPSVRGRAAAAYGSNCVQVLDAYGRVSAKCF